MRPPSPTRCLSGVVDFSNAIAAKDWATVDANADLTKVPIEGGRWFWVGVNNQSEPLTSNLVRQAIAHAVDRQAIVDAVLLRPRQAHPRRCGARVELGPRGRPQGVRDRRQSGEGEGAARRGWLSRRVRHHLQDRHGMAAADGDGAADSGQPRRGRDQRPDLHHGHGAVAGRGVHGAATTTSPTCTG